MNTGVLVERMRLPLLVSYCSDIFAAKDISSVQHGAAVQRTCVTYMVTRENTISGKVGGEKSVTDNKMVRGRCLEIGGSNSGSVNNTN